MAESSQANVDATTARNQAKSRRVIGIVSKASTEKKQTSVAVEPTASKGGIFGMKAQAYWESIGVLPLAFAGFGIVALAIKMLKVKGGELRSGPEGINKVTIPKSAITSVEEEAELHVFKCGGCGYEMYPARGREFKFFPDSFKCPLCGTPKSEFWDLNDPDDPRNQEDDEEEEEEIDIVDQDSGSGGTALVNPDEPSQGSDGAGSATMDRAESDPSK